MKKVLTIIGTRPEAIKLAPVVKVLEARAGTIESVVCATAQHRVMLDQVLDLFEIAPDYDLDVMRERQTPTQVASIVLSQLEQIFQVERPDWVFVQGDTTTAMAAAIAAFYQQVRVGHVEAGLRTNDKWQPFPEEINRRIVGVTADLHFAPTEEARRNLIHENVPEKSVRVTGNTVIDALQHVSALPLAPQAIKEIRDAGLEFLLSDNGIAEHLLLVTAHRRENHGEPLEGICYAIRELAETFGNRLKIIYPVHLNPNVQDPVYRILGDVSNVFLSPPLGYMAFVHLLKKSSIVLTDSGGLQEEAPGLGIPVLVLRETTERPEGVRAGTVRLVGTKCADIVRETSTLLNDESAYLAMASATNPYGDGKASKRIVDAILKDVPIGVENDA